MMPEASPRAAGASAADSRHREDFLADVLRGLEREPKALPCKYLYDAEGSRLFEEIMALPEYYLARCETEILVDRREDILAAMGGSSFRVVDLGAGNGEKTMLLLKHFQARGALRDYVPVDISAAALRQLEGKLRERLPALRVASLRQEYLAALASLAREGARPKLALLLGSNIGNLSGAEARGFLSGLRAFLERGDRLLVGFDLRKEPFRLVRAYSDPAGVTGRFNLNLLERINRELGGEFRTDRFHHLAVYDPSLGAVRSFLVSRGDQEVGVARAGRSFRFRAGETIHTEDSHKYTREEVEGLAAASGFRVESRFTDRRGFFLDALLAPA